MPSTTGAYSPAASNSPTVPRRRLSSFSRRGSTSAPDPWDLHHVEAPSSSTSRLHIVRLPPPTQEEIAKFEKEHGHARRSSWGPAAIPIPKSAAHERLSGRTSEGKGAGDIPSSPERRNSFSRRIHPSTLSQPMAPQQLYDLAMSSIYPKANSDGVTALPAVFTPLPSTHYLPFIVRSTEVSQLLSQGHPKRLWALIKQIYPQNLTVESNDPTKWPFSQLERWMFKVDRHEASDRLWVKMARKCISRRSDPLWEKLKNALGVPPELEGDEDEEVEEAENSVKPDLASLGKGKLVDLGSALDDGTDDEATGDELIEPITALGMTGLLMEPIYPISAEGSPAILPMASPMANEENFGFGGPEAGMEVIGEEEEEEKASNVEAQSEKPVSEATPDLEEEDDHNVLDPKRMVGLTIVSRSRRVPLQDLVHKYDVEQTTFGSEGSEGSVSGRPTTPAGSDRGNPLFPRDFAELTMTPSAPSSVRRDSLSGSRPAVVLEQGRLRIGGYRRPHGSDYALSTTSDGSERGG